MKRRRSPWYYGWNIVGLVIVAQMFSMGLPINCFSLFLEQWSRQFHAPISLLELSLTIFSLACVPLGPLTGWCADRISTRRMFGIGLALVALFHVAISRATSAHAVLWLYALIAPVAILGSATIPAQAVVSRWFWRRRGLAMGLTAFGLALAGVVFPPIAVALIRAVGWSGTWLVFGVIIAVVVIPVMLLGLRDRPAKGESKGYLDEAPGGESAARLPLKTMLRRPNFWFIGGAFLCLWAVNLAVTVNLTPLVERRGYSLESSAVLLSALSFSALVGKILCGVLADRFGSRLPIVAIGLLTTVSVALLAVPTGFTTLVVILIALGLTQGIWTLVAAATATEFGPECFGQAYGVIVMFASVASVGPPILARLVELIGTYRVGLGIFAVIALAGSILALLLNQPASREAGQVLPQASP